jgi:putative alpha-1,2-mannosidase
MQWRWGSPFHADGVVALWPDREKFTEELQKYLDGTKERVGWWNPGGNYWHGNEPYIHAPYLFNAAGRPDLTQQYVRHMLKTKYSDDYVGLDGNDDGGTLSSWYIFSALGFYPVAGTTRYEIGSPVFTSARINVGNGKELIVSAPDTNPDTVHVKRVLVNGDPLESHHIDHAWIAQGGRLEFEMR